MLHSLVLLLVRVMLAIMFIDGGRRHVADPKGRGDSLGMSTTSTFILGLVEVIAGVLVLLGIWTNFAALALMIVMLGAIYFKIFIWHLGIYGDKNNGWYYDLLLFTAASVLFAMGPGPIAITALL